MDIIIDISNSKIATDVTRKARMYAFRWDADMKFIAMDIYVTHYKNDVLIETKALNTFSITFDADNNTLVNPQTGDYLIKDETGNYTADQISTGAGEYDFFIGLASAGPVDIIGLIKKHMTLADQLGRYDV